MQLFTPPLSKYIRIIVYEEQIALQKVFPQTTLANMAGFNLGMLKAASQARAKQKKYQEMLEGVSVNGQSKNAKVRVTVNGAQKIKSLTIDPELIAFVYENYVSKGQEETMLAKSIMEATEDALSKIQMEIVKKMQESGSMSEIMEMLGGAK